MTLTSWHETAARIEGEHRAAVTQYDNGNSKPYRIVRVQASIENLMQRDLDVLRADLAGLTEGHRETMAMGAWRGEVSMCVVFTVDIRMTEQGSFRRAQAIRRAFELTAHRIGERYSYVTIYSPLTAYLNQVNAGS